MHGSGYLEYAAADLRNFLGDVKRLLFVPFALFEHDAYAERVRARFETLGCGVDSVHQARDMRQAVEGAEAIFIGGGNTFRLLKSLSEAGLLTVIRARVEEGMPYVGSSAGSNVAAPTIRTTNDMPIVEPPSFEALGLVPFQINPHYQDADQNSTHMGETREERILQYLEENDTPVVGLREGAMLRVENGRCELRGSGGARLFRRGQEPKELRSGATLDELMARPLR